MAAESQLEKLLASMSPQLDPVEYVFLSAAPNNVPSLPTAPIFSFYEDEGLTLVVRRDEAIRAKLNCEFPCRRITLTVHSSLSAVGFLAVLCRELAEAGISVNAASAYYHDHLFVPSDRANEALELLQNFAVKAAR